MADRDNAPRPVRRGGGQAEARLGRRGLNNRSSPEMFRRRNDVTGENHNHSQSSTGKTGETNKTGKCCCDDTANTQSYKKGGKVKATGKAKVHKGEVVLPIEVVNKLKKLMK